jgi:hypothetical protein
LKLTIEETGQGNEYSISELQKNPNGIIHLKLAFPKKKKDRGGW